MCGIAGIVWQDPERPGDPLAVRAMLRAIAHRGPDGEGVEVLGPAALGHRRLKIIDLSAAAAQPLSNEDGSVWVTFNGEGALPLMTVYLPRCLASKHLSSRWKNSSGEWSRFETMRSHL